MFIVGVAALRRSPRSSAASPRTRRMMLAARVAAGRRRRDRLPDRARPDHHDLPGRQGAQPRHGRLRRHVRRRRRRRPHPRRRPDRDRLALDLLHQRADRPARRAPRAARPRRVRAPDRPLRPPRRDHRHRRPGRHRLRPDPRGRADRRWGDPVDPHLPRRRRRCCSSRSSLVETRAAHALLPIRILADRTRGSQPLRHAHRRRRHVRDVLLPRPLHPAGARLLARCKAGFAFLPF